MAQLEHFEPHFMDGRSAPVGWRVVGPKDADYEEWPPYRIPSREDLAVWRGRQQPKQVEMNDDPGPEFTRAQVAAHMKPKSGLKQGLLTAQEARAHGHKVSRSGCAYYVAAVDDWFECYPGPVTDALMGGGHGLTDARLPPVALRSVPYDAEPVLTTNAVARKNTPIFSGCLRYFPRALAAVAVLSQVGNEQHNPGSPLHWDRSKSGDEWDALARHLLEVGTVDSDGIRHAAKVAWRALAGLEKELEAAAEEP